MRSYGQFCPVARTAEIFAERWTPIIVRNLLNGCQTFTEIRQGAPGIPTALLDTLERHGIVVREPGRSGARWLEIEPQHMQPAYVLWATTKLVDVSMLPERTVVVRFELSDRPGESYWLLLHRPVPELCTRATGHAEDIVARTDAACLIDIHLRRTTYRQALRSGRLALAGPPSLTRALMSWIRPSPYAEVAPGGA